MRQRRPTDTPPPSPYHQRVCDTDSVNGDEACKEESMLKSRCAKDVFARMCFVGIFITENMLHCWHFEAEIAGMVQPAWAPLPREIAVCIHIAHIILGFFGAVFVIISGFDTAGRTALTKGTSMMLVFMCSITWTWWINRQGILYSELDPYPFWDVRCSVEKRNRTVHILKNLSIVGALTMVQQLAKYDMAARPCRPTLLQGLVTSLRPWSLTASLAPLLVMLAVLQCKARLQLPGYAETLVFLLSIMAVQVAANLANSYADFKKGLDTKETAGDRTLVDNLVSPAMHLTLLVLSLVWWFAYFTWSVFSTGFHPVVISLAALGTFLASGYTVGPAPLKYAGLGDLAVFLAFGPALIAYGCTVLTGGIRWDAICFVLPVTMYVVATLHANNYRDIESDKQAGTRTVAITLGAQASLHYYSLLLFGAHAVALIAGWHFQCVGALASLCVFPQSAWLCVRIRRRELLRTQDEETAKTAMMFGLALAIGIITMPDALVSYHGLGFALLVTVVLKVFGN